MGRKCSVQGCLSDSNRDEDVGVTFHKVPMQPDIRCKWLGLCRISEEKKSIKVIHVCSRHFLRADFCNFKGKKYMLRQGVFPSVFPWDKSKLEAIKSEKQQVKAQTSSCSLEETGKIAEIKIEPNSTDIDSKINIESVSRDEIKEETISGNLINFSIDDRITALDFNNKWCPATIKEVDEGENEVLIHFETDGNEYDEWICMDSPRLRSFNWKEDSQKSNESDTDVKIKEEGKDEIKKKIAVSKFDVGERCLAYWSERRKFPATITKVLENGLFKYLSN